MIRADENFRVLQKKGDGVQYNPALDGLRAIAVLAVMALHCRVPGFSGGFAGVDVFFVLSGYLITELLRQEHAATGRIAFGRFTIRRLSRLWPPLLALVTVALVVGPHFWPTLDHVRAAMVSGLYMSDYIGAYSPFPRGPLTHTWSLAIGEKYYLIWPAVLFFILSVGGRWRTLLAMAALFVLATEWRIAIAAADGFWAAYSRLDTRLSGFLLKGLIAFLGKARFSARIADALAAGSLTVLAACVAILELGENRTLTWGVMVTEGAAAVLILSLVSAQGLAYRILATKPLAQVGLISYSVYLWHYPVALAVRDILPWPVTFAGTLACSLILAYASWVIIERPLRDWRRRWRPTTPTAGRLVPVVSER